MCWRLFLVRLAGRVQVAPFGQLGPRHPGNFVSPLSCEQGQLQQRAERLAEIAAGHPEPAQLAVVEDTVACRR